VTETWSFSSPCCTFVVVGFGRFAENFERACLWLELAPVWAGVGRVWRVCGVVVTGRLERRELQSDSVFGFALWICYLAWYYCG